MAGKGIMHMVRETHENIASLTTGVDGYLRPSASSTPPPQWEYAIVNLPVKGDLVIARTLLDKMGAFGWELVLRHDSGMGAARHGSDDQLTLVFKRPL
jgi:hypothetical protein